MTKRILVSVKCPFCGCDEVRVYESSCDSKSMGHYYCSCEYCGCSNDEIFKYPKCAVNYWERKLKKEGCLRCKSMDSAMYRPRRVLRDPY